MTPSQTNARNELKRLASRLNGVSESATLKLNSMVQALRAEGKNILNFSAGEPDFAVPDVAKEAIRKALDQNRSKYTPVPGIPELREAVAQKINLQQPSFGKWKSANIVVSNGGKQALFNVMMALLDEGDEVLIPGPYWLSYPEMVKLFGGRSVFLNATLSQNFKITPAQLEAALSPRSRILILNSPSNPTGALYSRAELRALGEVLLRHPEGHHVWVISDEIYDRIIFSDQPGGFTSFGEACPELVEQTVTVNGMSKSAAMTGWRIGWSVAPKELTAALITLQGQSTSGINAPAQWASVAALALPESSFHQQVQTYERRRNLLLEILGKTPKLDLYRPGGAFYAFVGVGQLLKKAKDGEQEDSMGFCERLLSQVGVAAVPGTPFGAPEFIRLSFATDEKTIQEGCEKILQFAQHSS